MKMIRWGAIYFLFLIVGLLFTSEAVAQRGSKKNTQENKLKNNLEAEKFFIEAQKYFMLEDFPKALGLFKKSLELEPDNPAIHFKLAETYMNSGETLKALPHANKALLLNDNNKYYFLMEAQVYTHLHRYDDAINTYESLVKKIKGAEEYLFQLAALYNMQKEYEKALDAYARAEAVFGPSDQINFQKQRIYLKLDKIDEAIAEGKKLIEANPGQSEYVIALVEMLHANGRQEEANELLSSVLDSDPDNYMALITLAKVYQKNNQKEMAREYLLKAFSNTEMDVHLKVQTLLEELKNNTSGDREYLLEMADMLIDTHPDNGIAYAVYGDLLFQYQDLDNAKEKYRKAIQYGEDNFIVWQNLLQIELNLGEFDSVIENTDKALEIYPNQATIYYFGGTAHMVKKNYTEAITLFEQGKKYAANNINLLSIINGQLGDAYYGIEAFGKSDKAYEAALDANPDNDHALNNYSYYLALRKEKLDLAKKMSTRLIKNNPNNQNYLDTHAWVLYMLGEYEQARKVIEKAIQGNTSGTIIEHYGDILYKLGDVEGAVIQWQRAKGMDETSDLIDKKIADRKLYE